jgi:hypothetical protein
MASIHGVHAFRNLLVYWRGGSSAFGAVHGPQACQGGCRRREHKTHLFFSRAKAKQSKKNNNNNNNYFILMFERPLSLLPFNLKEPINGNGKKTKYAFQFQIKNAVFSS